jgi:hypothetical protein
MHTCTISQTPCDESSVRLSDGHREYASVRSYSISRPNKKNAVMSDMRAACASYEVTMTIV